MDKTMGFRLSVMRVGFGLQYEIKYRPSYSLLDVRLDPNERIRAEAGAMTYMSPSMQVKTLLRHGGGAGGFLRSLGVSLLGGQSFFVNEYSSPEGGVIGLVSAPVGDIGEIEVGEAGWILQKSAYVASTEHIDLDIKWQGFAKGLFGQGLFMLRTSGTGKLFINTFGALDKHTLATGESLIVDNFHLVAFPANCKYEVKKVGEWKETLFSGEGLVTEIEGPGDIYLQTKNLQEFCEWLWTLLAPKVRQTKAR
jgi:uncharacterized protein (TIGR00266 family)